MKEGMTDQALVVLNVSPGLEEPLIDWLLENHETGFSSQEVGGHGTRLDDLSAAEQVSGYRRRVQFQIQIPAATVDAFLRSAGTEFGRADVHYWVVPVLLAGQLQGPKEG